MIIARSTCFAVSVALLMSVSSCQIKDEYSAQRISELEKKIASLEERLASLDSSQKATDKKISDIETLVNPLQETLNRLVAPVRKEEEVSKASSSNQDNKVTVEDAIRNLLSLVDWNCKFVPGDYNNHSYSISYTLRNDFNKNIKLIEAGIQFKDLLGEKLYSIRINPDLKIAIGKSVTYKGHYDINQFMSGQLRMKDIDKKDIVAELVVMKVVFDDNTVAKF